jgi:YidC/Oxa1 family membrane protein insertase
MEPCKSFYTAHDSIYTAHDENDRLFAGSISPDESNDYMMPVMFMVILNNFSSGLTYYYFLANILTFVQNYISKKMINADAVLARLEENSKKPLKKSKWQMRLEEAAKQRGVTPPKR